MHIRQIVTTCPGGLAFADPTAGGCTRGLRSGVLGLGLATQ